MHVINGETAAVYEKALFLRLVINNCVSSHMWLMVIRTVCKNYLITPRVPNARKIRYADQQFEYPGRSTLNERVNGEKRQVYGDGHSMKPFSWLLL